MIKLKDWLVEYNPLDKLYALSHSQHVEELDIKGGHPYHIGRLDSDLFNNTNDCLHNLRQEKWQIVFIGSFSKCVKRQGDLCIMKKWDADQLEEWEKETFFEFQKDDDDEPPDGPATKTKMRAKKGRQA